MTANRPTGTVSFLFTDIEGSTPLWEQHPEAMRAALERHDAILRTAIDAHGGFVFSTAGDAFSAAFHTPGDAVDAALVAQGELQAELWPEDASVKVRMGVHLGTVQERDGDYFGSAVNRAARLMGLAHGGQVLVSLVVEEAIRDDLTDGVGLVGLGEHALKGLSRPESVFQLTAPDLVGEFPALWSAMSVPGNLPVPSTSFVGRDLEVAELVELVGVHRLVTLTGVGGVGKTRLAIEVAAEVAGEFGDGVWLVELAPVGDPASVPDVVATTLGITPQAGLSITDSVVRALSGRRLLIVLDNCEHVLDAAADLVEAVLAGTESVKVLATSREGLRVGAEQLWPVPSLDVDGGAASAAVSLFTERARSVNPAFELDDSALIAVIEICERLDGIALAIELAAARTVSMNVRDIRDRLDDRFRLLAGSRRGLERHQTLRHAVGWSFDLLDDDERAVLCRCAVFADGFDLAAAAHLCDELDEYVVLDVLDSLVRKSLVVVGHSGGHARYRMLETIRQYAEDQLAGLISGVRDRHARWFAAEVQVYWELWDGPDQRIALDWVEVEFANLRAGFAWATRQGDMDTASAIAADTTMLGVGQTLEPVGWAERILTAATAGDVVQVPRLYTAASLCLYTGRHDDGLVYARTALELEDAARYDPFPHGLSRHWEALAHLYANRAEQALEVFADLAARTGPAHVYGCCGQTHALAMLGRRDEAAAIADESLAAALGHANPYFVAHGFYAHGLAFARDDPLRALQSYRRGIDHARQQRFAFFEAVLARAAAGIEAFHGDPDQALVLFDRVIESLTRSGHLLDLGVALADLAWAFHRFGDPQIAAALYGAATQLGTPTRGALRDRLCEVLGDTDFDRWVATCESMEPADAGRYARQQIALARRDIGAGS